jgi:hypothetical protein
VATFYVARSEIITPLPWLTFALPFSDRLDPGVNIDSLINSIREHGQKLPILVRRLPDGEMEIVYGVRRVLACFALGYDVRAMVTEMSDEEALIAKRVENNERLTSGELESNTRDDFIDAFSRVRGTLPPDWGLMPDGAE